VARFEKWMADPDSPIRAIRHQLAREGEFADIPSEVAPALRDGRKARWCEGCCGSTWRR
jgi:hypothetical protein